MSSEGKINKPFIDWEKINSSLLKSINEFEQTWTTDEESVRQILKVRSKALAQKPKLLDKKANFMEVILFGLAYETYAVELKYVHEVCSLKDYTPLPCTPAYVIGIMNVRGRIISIVDIKKFFDLPVQGLTNLNVVIILQSKNMEFGILADHLVGACNIEENTLQRKVSGLSGIREKYLKGISNKQEIVLDAEKMLSDPNIIVNERIT